MSKVYDYYSQLSLTEIIRTDWKDAGLGTFLFAGMPYYIASGLLNVASNYVLGSLVDLSPEGKDVTGDKQNRSTIRSSIVLLCKAHVTTIHEFPW